jgi:predicted AAA+ superfamily ATPase
MANANDRYPRSLKKTVESDLAVYPVVAVMGARQVGKSTLCQEVARERGFAHRTLDDRDVREQALTDPEGFLASLGERGALIDEAQRAPDLLLAIKAVVDKDQRNGLYLLSGSNQPRMGKAVGDSLLGRAAYRTLRPLTLSELRFDEQHPGWSFLFVGTDDDVLKELSRRASASGELDWQDIVQTGGFPRVVSAPPEQRLRLLDDYVEVFSNRDVRELLAVETPARLEAFVRLVAARTGQELNASKMSSELGVGVTTIRRWVEALQRSYLVELLPPYSRNAGSRVIKTPKTYMVDAALALAAARETTPTGFHLETLIASDMFVWKDGDPTRDLFHWRLNSGQEVDFVLEEDAKLVPVEIKASSSIDRSAARHLRTFRQQYSSAVRALLVSCDPDIRILEDGLVACPWWAVV